MTDMLRRPTPSGSPLAVPSPHLLPPPLRPPSVDLHALDDDPVDVSRLLHGEVLVPDVREDAFGIPLQRRAPSAASPAAKADLLAPDELEPSDLAGDHWLLAVLEDDAGVRRPVGPAVDAPGRVLGAADGHGEGRLRATDDVIFDDPEAAAESTVSRARFDVQFVPIHEDRHVPLVHLVRRDVRLAVSTGDQTGLAVSVIPGAPPSRLRLHDGKGFAGPVVHAGQNRREDGEEVARGEAVG